MPIVMNMRWKGITKEQYDEAVALVDWEDDVPNGAKYHVAAVNNTGLLVTDVWESADDFNRFVEQRLMPGVQQLGMPGEPEIEIAEVHRIFAPNPA